jgi:pimeloyl-ACP methyl ester carboxylesterase
MRTEQPARTTAEPGDRLRPNGMSLPAQRPSRNGGADTHAEETVAMFVIGMGSGRAGVFMTRKRGVMGAVSEEVMVTCADGRQLQALTTTSGSAAATVVLHMGTPAGLVPLPSQLVGGSRCRIVTYARPGCGKSTPRPARTVADAASDTTTILDALGIDSFVTAGWSAGSPHALACAALLSDRCRATASVAGFAPIDAGVEDGPAPRPTSPGEAAMRSSLPLWRPTGPWRSRRERLTCLPCSVPNRIGGAHRRPR